MKQDHSKLPEKRVFVVERRATRRCNRKDAYVWVVSIISMCGHQAHDVHTPGTCQKWEFSIFSKFCSKINSHLHVPAVCLMCAHTWKILPSSKAMLKLSNALSHAKIGQKIASVALCKFWKVFAKKSPKGSFFKNLPKIDFLAIFLQTLFKTCREPQNRVFVRF